MEEYFLFELTEDFDDKTNSRRYKKGEKLTGWHQPSLHCYWILNLVDTVPERIVKQLFKITFEKVA